MPSCSDSTTTPLPVSVTIESRFFASELSVVDAGYALVASGVGRLSLELLPGRYQLRQRIGYLDQVEELLVSSDAQSQTVRTPALEIASPIPLPGTSLVASPPGTRPFSYGSGSFRFVLRTPVRDSIEFGGKHIENLQAEMRRMRLESFDGAVSMPFSEGTVAAETQGVLVFSAQPPPGDYLIVQGLPNNRQLCMPVPLREGRTTIVFCNALWRDDTEPIAVQLDRSSMAMLRDDELAGEYEGSLFRLEAARKTMAAGNRAYGWSAAVPGRETALQLERPAPAEGASEPNEPGTQSKAPQPENVVLGLMDVYLGWTCLKPPPEETPESPAEAEHPRMTAERAALQGRLKELVPVLGSASADVVAMAHELSLPSSELAVLPVTSPPILRKTWSRLLAFPDGDKQAEAAMPFSFQLEPSSSWFLWSEVPGARATALAASKAARRPGGINLFPHREERRKSRGRLIDTLSAGLGAKVTDVLRSVIGGLVGHKEAAPAGAIEADLATATSASVTYKSIETMLAALLQNPSFQDWMSKAYSVFEAEAKTVQDGSMRRLISSLRSLSDPTLIQALGAERAAQAILGSLRLPKQRVTELMRKLLLGVVSRLEPDDRAALLVVLRGAVNVAESWLNVPLEPKEVDDAGGNSGAERQTFLTLAPSRWRPAQLRVLDRYFQSEKRSAKLGTELLSLPLTVKGKALASRFEAHGDRVLTTLDAVAPPWGESRGDVLRLWVVGATGMGKTALTQWVRSEHFERSGNAFDARRRWGCVLVFIKARDFVTGARDSNDTERWLLEAVQNQLFKGRMPFGDERLLSRLLQSGALGVVVDGVDEAGRTGAVTAFAERYSVVPMLVTSQQMGNPSQFTVAMLPAKMTEHVEALTHLLLKDQGLAKALVQRLGETGLKRSLTSGYDVRLVCDLARTAGIESLASLPSSRAELYEVSLAKGWPDSPPEKLPGEHAQLESSAWNLMVERKPYEDRRRMDGKDVSENLLMRLGDARASGSSPVRIVRRAGKGYEFAHDQMLAYLAARRFAQHGLSTEQLSEMLERAAVWKHRESEQDALWEFATSMLKTEQLVELIASSSTVRKWGSLRWALLDEARRRGVLTLEAEREAQVQQLPTTRGNGETGRS